jgi:protein-S-isoprenylcysteine O-methyltransferase Ste14
MLMWVRQLLSLVALPFMVTIVIPVGITRRNHITFISPSDAPSFALILGGVAALAGGLALFATCVFYFWTRGRGTLAPWDPPRQFVADGPYRFVRNPMISGVIVMLVGEAGVWRSTPLAEWAALFTLINVIYLPLLEEPMLAARFGDTYARYRRAVPRVVPRLLPWTPER